MPIFKALASIVAWILFIYGCITLLFTEIGYWTVEGLGTAPSTATYIGWGLGVAELTLAVVVMKLRKMLE